MKFLESPFRGEGIVWAEMMMMADKMNTRGVWGICNHSTDKRETHISRASPANIFAESLSKNKNKIAQNDVRKNPEHAMSQTLACKDNQMWSNWVKWNSLFFLPSLLVLCPETRDKRQSLPCFYCFKATTLEDTKHPQRRRRLKDNKKGTEKIVEKRW